MELCEHRAMIEADRTSPYPDKVIPQLQDFVDYRDFIRERLKFEIKRNPRLSFHYFSKKLQISGAFLSLLLAKKKHASLESLSRVSTYFQLDQHDRVTLLFTLLEATSAPGTERIFFKMMADQVKAFKIMNIELPKDSMLDLQHIYKNEINFILSMLAQTSDFKNDVDWVLSRLRHTPESRELVRQALDEVTAVHTKLNFENNKSNINATVPGGSWVTPVYKAGWLLHGKAIQDTEACKPTTVASLSMSFNEEGAKEAQKAYRAFLKELENIALKSEPTDRVFVFNGALFCVASPPDEKTPLSQ